ncbi:unnamed protein product [Boreogadus saida]
MRRRSELGEFHHLLQELRLDDDRFKRYFRLSVAMFDDLLARVGARISRQDTNYRRSISAAERLSICLRTAPTAAVRDCLPVGVVLPLPGLGRVAANNAGREAIRIRETLTSYFSEEGTVSWQDEI